jgi:hypothetical protein
LAIGAWEAGFVFRAARADCAYGDQDGFRGDLAEAGLPFVMTVKPRRGTWAHGPDAHTPVDAARAGLTSLIGSLKPGRALASRLAPCCLGWERQGYRRSGRGA